MVGRHSGGMTADLPWPLPERPALRDRLVRAWSTERGYHDLRHLAEVLQRIDELGEADNMEVVLAAWFHDAVHDLDGENEERSARLAESELAELAVVTLDNQASVTPSVDIAEVARLVRLTEHHRAPVGDRNAAVICDADLAILAAAPDRYADYVSGVRQEYAAVPDADFRRGRAAVLRDLLAKPTLFHTEHAKGEWEATARTNVAAEIVALERVRE